MGGWGSLSDGARTYRTSTMNTRVLLSSIFFIADSVVSGYLRICAEGGETRSASARTHKRKDQHAQPAIATVWHREIMVFAGDGVKGGLKAGAFPPPV
jgi:hypothetical protein